MVSRFNNSSNNEYFQVQMSFKFYEVIECLENSVCRGWEFQKIGAKKVNLFWQKDD
jgi:hypothetical protein